MIVKKRILKRIIKEELNRFLTESEYTVRRGDSLGRIARLHGVSLDMLLTSNSQFDRSLLRNQGSSPGPNDRIGQSGRNPNWIYPGEVITIPGSTESGPSSARTGPGPTSTSGWIPHPDIPGMMIPAGTSTGSPPPTSAPVSSPPDSSPPVSSPASPRRSTPPSSSSPSSPSPPPAPTIATPGSGPISVSGNNIEIDSRGRVDIDGSTYSLQADVMGGVALEVERIDASGSTVMITVDPAMGRTQTKPLRQHGLAQIRRGAGSAEFRVEPDPDGPDSSSPAIVFTRV